MHGMTGLGLTDAQRAEHAGLWKEWQLQRSNLGSKLTARLTQVRHAWPCHPASSVCCNFLFFAVQQP